MADPTNELLAQALGWSNEDTDALVDHVDKHTLTPPIGVHYLTVIDGMECCGWPHENYPEPWPCPMVR